MLENPLLPWHEQAQALLLPFGPDIQIVESYGATELEYAAIRKSAALMDCPHRAVVELTGRDRLAFLNNLVTNDIKALEPGRGCYAYLLNTRGRIVQDMNVLNLTDRTLLDVDARLTADLCRTLENYIFGEAVKVRNYSESHGRLSLIGPTAVNVLQRLGAHDAAEMVNLAIGPVRLADSEAFIFRNDLCGTSQYEIIVPRTDLESLWQTLQNINGLPSPAPGQSRQPLQVRAIGWSAFNIARIESGSLFFGIDITDQNLPMETGSWYLRAVSLKKGCYLGQEVVARMHAHNSVARVFTGLIVQGAVPPVAGEELRDEATPVGMVTSSCISPMLGQVAIAMGYVKRGVAQNNRHFNACCAAGPTTLTLRSLPFWIPPAEVHPSPDTTSPK